MEDAYPWLFIAARFGNLENVQRCLRMGDATEQRAGSFERTALFEAVLPNHFAVAQLLLQNGADVTCVDRLGWTALHNASLHGSTECASLLLDHGADMWQQTSFGITPLHFAASRNHLETMQMLLSRTLPVPRKRSSHEDEMVRSVMDMAIRRHSASVAELLIQTEDVDVDTVVQTVVQPGQTLMQTAVFLQRWPIVEIFNERAVERAKCVAFGMVVVSRLGDESLFSSLDTGVVDMIMKFYDATRERGGGRHPASGVVVAAET